MGNTLRKLGNAEKAPIMQKAAAEPVAAAPGPALAQEAAAPEKPSAAAGVDLESEPAPPGEEPAPDSAERRAPDGAGPQPEPEAAQPADESAPEAAGSAEPEVDPTSESKEGAEPSKEAEPEPVAMDTSATAQSEPESAVETTGVADPEPEPEPAPEPAPEPQSIPNPVPEAEPSVGTVSELAPDGIPEPHTEILNQEVLADPVVSSLPPSEPSTLEASVAGDGPESPEGPALSGNSEQTAGDGAEEISGLLGDLVLKGADLVADPMPADVQSPELSD